jgi:hypothetical protein
MSVAIDLMSENSIQEFMHKRGNQPLRIIIQRFIDTNINLDETILIVQFLNTYA